MFECINCKKIITLQEKCAIEQTAALRQSLNIQERNLRIAMWAMIFSAV
jgi:hypothetical protein